MMKAIVYSEARKFELKDVPTPKCGDMQVLIKVAACGICKTDVHIHTGNFISRFPLTPGHEFAGVVVEIGSGVTAFKIGDRVTADNTVLCGECYYCRRDQPLYCENFYSLGCNGPGGYAEYVVVNQDKIFRLSDSLDFQEAIFAEPTACAVHGMDMIAPHFGDQVLMFGAGPTGIILAQLLRMGGAQQLVVAASSRQKLEWLEQYGIAETVFLDRNDYGAHRAAIKGINPRGFDIVIDATGHAPLVEECFNFTKRGSKVVVYGVCGESDTIKVNPYKIFNDELKIIGSFAQTHCFDRALAYLESRRLKVDGLVTHRFGLADYGKALDVVMHSRDHIKVVIDPAL